MTNEEIQHAAEAFFERRRRDGERIDWLGVGLLAEHMRQLVSQAHEEAALVADVARAYYHDDDPLGTNDPHGLQELVAEEIAQRIRALKDSLVQETASSAS